MPYKFYARHYMPSSEEEDDEKRPGAYFRKSVWGTKRHVKADPNSAG